MREGAARGGAEGMETPLCAERPLHTQKGYGMEKSAQEQRSKKNRRPAQSAPLDFMTASAP